MKLNKLILFLFIGMTILISSSDLDHDRKHKEAFKRRQLLRDENSQRFSLKKIYEKAAIAAKNRDRIALSKKAKQTNNEIVHFFLYKMGWLSSSSLEKNDFLYRQRPKAAQNGFVLESVFFDQWLEISELINKKR